MLKALAFIPFLALSAAAQQGTVPPLTFPVPTVKAHAAPAHSTTVQMLAVGCPVGISAQPPRGNAQSLQVVSVQDAALKTGSTAKTGVHVQLSSLAAMRTATVAVRYRAFGNGLRPASPTAGYETKTFELDTKGAPDFRGNLLVSGSVDIIRVRVLKVVYTDGTTWQAEASTSCSAKPSHVVLVGTR
jgi:hypothetical protein